MSSDRYWQARKVTLIGALVNTLLGLIKLIGGFLFHSHGLMADGVHSFSDLITDAMVLFASRFGSQEADESHQYGHQRIETAATMMLALLLILAGLGIAWDAIFELIHHTHTKPGWIALPIAGLSILANELLFHYTRHVGNQINSTLIIANAWHHRSDAAASIVVTIGILGALFGFLYLDAVAAIIVGLLIIKMGFEYAWNSIKELVDTAVDPEKLTQIQEHIRGVQGVKKIHQLRSRLMGGDIFIDVHILVSPFISVSEGHYIAQHVHHLLMHTVPRIRDVTVHVDPEDDETACPSLHLPNRKQLEESLFLPLKARFPDIQDWVIHYLDGKIRIDLLLNERDRSEQLSHFIKNTLSTKEIAEVRLFYAGPIIMK